MPRSGSTLLESILSIRNDVYDLGEINILEESFLEYKKSINDMNLAELYEGKVIKELDTQGLRLEACSSGLEACFSRLAACGLRLQPPGR